MRNRRNLHIPYSKFQNKSSKISRTPFSRHGIRTHAIVIIMNVIRAPRNCISPSWFNSATIIVMPTLDKEIDREMHLDMHYEVVCHKERSRLLGFQDSKHIGIYCMMGHITENCCACRSRLSTHLVCTNKVQMKYGQSANKPHTYKGVNHEDNRSR